MSFSYSTLAQPYIFAAFFYAGAVSGIFYSIFRFVRRALGGGKAVTAATDVAFFALFSAAVLFVLFYAVNMRLRLYYVFGIAAGFSAYLFGIEPLSRFMGKKFTKKKVDKRFKKDCNNN